MRERTVGWRILVPLLVLGLLGAVALRPAFGGLAEAQAPTVNFRATAISGEAAAQRCSNYAVSIRVDEILQDTEGELTVGQEFPVYYQTTYGFSSGDYLEVFGTSYLTEGPLPCAGSVKVEEDAGDYIGLVVKLIGTVVDIEQRMGGITWIVEVDEILFGPPISGQLPVQWLAVPECQGTFDPDIEVGDSVDVLGMYAEGGVEVCPSANFYIIRPIRLYLPLVRRGNIAEE
jgi:hypothetical protein